MPPHPRPPTPVARILARLDEALGAKMPPRGIERVVGPGLAEMTVRRWRDGVSAPTGRKAQLFAEAMGLRAEHVMGWEPLPADWPPPAVVERFDAQRKPVGRPPKPPGQPAPTAPPEMHRLVAELRELMAAMRGGGVATGRPVPHAPTLVGLAGDDDVATAEQMAVLTERLEALAEMLATHDAATLGLWEAAVEERQAIVERLERIERILSRPLFDCDDAPAPNGDDAA